MRSLKAAGATVFTILVLLPIITGAQTITQQPLPGPYLRITESNETITITTPYYSFNISKINGSILSYVAKGPVGEILTVGPGPVILYGASEDAISKVTWSSIQLIQLSDDEAVIVLRNATGAANLSLNIIVKSYTPQIDLVISPTPGYITVAVGVNGSLANWTAGVSYYSGYNLSVGGVDYNTSISIPGQFKSIALLGIVEENGTARVKYLASITRLPGYATPLTAGYYDLSKYNFSSHAIAVTYNIKENTTNMIGVSVTLTRYNPYVLVSSGAYDVVKALHPAAPREASQVVGIDGLLSILNDTITRLEDRIKRLVDENLNLTKQLDEYKGCEKTWKEEVKTWKMRYERLQEQLRSAGARTLGAFIVGIILGVIGGAYVINISGTKGIRGRRK